MFMKNELKKIGIPLLISFLILLLGTILFTTLYYFNIIGNKVFTILELILPLISFIIGGVIIGRHSKQKGWLEGLKLGSIIIILMALISFLGFNHNLDLSTTIYYIMIIAVTIFGSMLGINYQKKD